MKVKWEKALQVGDANTRLNTTEVWKLNPEKWRTVHEHHSHEINDFLGRDSLHFYKFWSVTDNVTNYCFHGNDVSVTGTNMQHVQSGKAFFFFCEADWLN